MARTVRFDTMKTRVRVRADVVSNNHISDSTVADLINEGLTENWDLLVSCAPPDYYSTSTNVSALPGISVYSIAADFYRLRAVQVLMNTEEYRPIGTLQDADIQRYRPPNTTATVRVRYIQTSPILVSDTDTFDGVNGWEELAVLYAAIDILNTKGQDPSSLMAKRDRFVERIKLNVQRDAGEPPRVRRARQRYDDRFGIGLNTVDGYILRGANIELYRYAGIGFT